MNLVKLLKKYNACQPAQEWAAQFTNPEEAWAKCEQPDWMLWIAIRLNPVAVRPALFAVADLALRKYAPAALDSAASTLKGEHKKSLLKHAAILRALPELNSETSDAASDAASYAASDASYAARAASDAARAASDAASYAADAASYAASDAASDASYAARAASYASDAASYAADAASYAASDAASDASYAARAASYAARAANYKEMADIVRKHLPLSALLEKVQ